MSVAIYIVGNKTVSFLWQLLPTLPFFAITILRDSMSVNRFKTVLKQCVLDCCGGN